MPSASGTKGPSPGRTAMSRTQPELKLEAGAYVAASSQKRERGSGRSKSLRRHVSHKAEASSDNITMVYRALRVEESPTKLRKVFPDTKDYTILSLHMFPCTFLIDFFSFSASSQCIAFNTASALSGHFTALTAHSDICCMSHPMWYVSNIFDLFFSTVNCVIQHRLVAHGQLQWLIVFGIPSKLSMPVSALGQSRALRSGTFVVGMSFIYSV